MIIPGVDNDFVIVFLLVNFGSSPVEIAVEFSILLTRFSNVYFESSDAIIPHMRIPKIVRIANAKTYFHERLLSCDLRLTLSSSIRGSLLYAFNI